MLKQHLHNFCFTVKCPNNTLAFGAVFNTNLQDKLLCTLCLELDQGSCHITILLIQCYSKMHNIQVGQLVTPHCSHAILNVKCSLKGLMAEWLGHMSHGQKLNSAAKIC